MRTTPALGGAAGRPRQIGEVAERTELSLRTLRHYDEIGLLQPSARSEGGFRLYTDDDVDRLLVIRRMKPLGFTLEAMQDVMRLIEALGNPGDATPSAELRARLRGVIDEAIERRQKLSHQLEMADEFIELLGRQLPR